MNNSVHSKETLVCEVCGKYGASKVGDHYLCVDCYQNAGSCCPEFGGFDLWKERDEDLSGPRQVKGDADASRER